MFLSCPGKKGTFPHHPIRKSINFRTAADMLDAKGEMAQCGSQFQTDIPEILLPDGIIGKHADLYCLHNSISWDSRG